MAQGLIEFDYSELGENAKSVKQVAARIKTLCRTAAEQVIEIGQLLLEVKSSLPHGQFRAWTESEFGWGQTTVTRFMQVTQRFQNNQIGHFGTSALYLLASDSVPEQAVSEALERAESGEKITHAVAKEIVEKHKPEKPKAIPAHAELVDDDSDEQEQESIWPDSPQQSSYETELENDQETVSQIIENSKHRGEAELLIEKIEKLIVSVEKLTALTGVGHNAKSRAVVNHLRDAIPLVKAMGKSWRN